MARFSTATTITGSSSTSAITTTLLVSTSAWLAASRRQPRSTWADTGTRLDHFTMECALSVRKNLRLGMLQYVYYFLHVALKIGTNTWVTFGRIRSFYWPGLIKVLWIRPNNYSHPLNSPRFSCTVLDCKNHSTSESSHWWQYRHVVHFINCPQFETRLTEILVLVIFDFRQEHQHHAKAVHGGDMPIKCGLCSKAFDTIQRQRIHRRDDHFKPAGNKLNWSSYLSLKKRYKEFILT